MVGDSPALEVVVDEVIILLLDDDDDDVVLVSSDGSSGLLFCSFSIITLPVFCCLDKERGYDSNLIVSKRNKRGYSLEIAVIIL